MTQEVQLDFLFQHIADNQLIHAVLSSPFQKERDQATKISLRPLMIKGKQCFQVSYFFSRNVIHKNLTSQETIQLLAKILPQFKQANFFTKRGDYHLLTNKSGKRTILNKTATKSTVPMAIDHDRKKNYVLQEGSPIPFLVELGIMTSEGKVYPKKYGKFRQINRFLEMIRDVLPYLKKEMRIIDFGCGKAYLTFALYHYLKIFCGYQIHVTGLDLKEEVIDHCQALANKLGYHDLHFSVGDINQHEPLTKIDLVITLHACDTATDAALEKAVRWGAEVILVVPCCQHELYSQVKSEGLNCLLQHGLLKERFAALATDAARAQVLQMLGYEVAIIEFVDLEHTLKNILIRAVKCLKNKERHEAVLKSYLEFKKLLSINPSIEQRFKNELFSR